MVGHLPEGDRQGDRQGDRHEGVINLPSYEGKPTPLSVTCSDRKIYKITSNSNVGQGDRQG